MSVSRREFLQAVGVSAASASLFGIALPGIRPALATPQIIQGRALVPTELTNGEFVWADTVLSIREYDAAWYATEKGLVPREHIQPIAPYTLPAEEPRRLPALVEVGAPVAAVRAYADAAAPLVTRIGHGGVMAITGGLTNAGGRWYELGDLGWTQALHWRELPDVRGWTWGRRSLEVDRARQMLTAYEGDTAVFHTQVSAPEDLPGGAFTLRRGDYTAPETSRHGIPYTMHMGDVVLRGAYWHNRFGRAHTEPAIELNVLAAKWLFHWTQDEISIRIR